ncbi:hypothetical protein [Segetibacter aerophilus]|uniref:hypothetical protein n=1 Tax=Segetibacter aerophilus TaxID=670293 RepID=UPI0011BD73F5|nr:hypothetical protein [Segetibacter aerophilus]
MIINLIVDLYGIYLLWTHKPNSYSFNIYTLIETVFLCVFYRKIIPNNIVKTLLLAFIAFFTVFWFIEIFIYTPKEFLWICVTVENIFIMATAIYYYYEQIFVLNKAFIYRYTNFWIVAAFFVNAAGTFFLLLYLSSLPPDVRENYYVINYLFTIIRSILLCIAFFRKNDNIEKQKFILT